MALILFTSLVLHSFTGTFNSNDTIGIRVSAELLKPVTTKEISLKVVVKNNTANSFSVLANRRIDYSSSNSRALGNYIIEIQKQQADSFHLFSPTADINPTYQQEVYININPGQSIIDTLSINGYNFSQHTKLERKFPEGLYRLRISFNANEWGNSQENSTNWIEFKIE